MWEVDQWVLWGTGEGLKGLEHKSIHNWALGIGRGIGLGVDQLNQFLEHKGSQGTFIEVFFLALFWQGLKQPHQKAVISSVSLCKDIAAARNDPNVKALVLRIDSPGCAPSRLQLSLAGLHSSM